MANILFLLILTLVQPQQQEIQQLQMQQQRQQQQLQQLQQDVHQQQQQLGRVTDAIDRVGREPKSTCSAELQWLNGVDGPGGKEPMTVSFNSATTVSLNLFGAVSRPQELCLPGEVRVTASYFDPANNLLCHGAIDGIGGLNGIAQNINLEIRPWSFEYFARWANDPSPVIKPPTRLVCVTPDGLDQVALENLQNVSSLRLRITAFPKAGGISTVDVRVNRQVSPGR